MAKPSDKSEGRALLPDYYARLGIAEDASPEDIRRVYGEKVRDAMGDRFRFMALNEAFDVLKDTAKRAAYDRRRRLGTQQESPAEVLETDEAHAQEADVTDSSPRETEVPAAEASEAGSEEASSLVPSALERTMAVAGFSLPTVCAIGLSPCPLIDRTVLPDDGFCPECGVLLGTALGDLPTGRPLPKLVDPQMREYPLRFGENTVGREGADVILPDKTVSRRHAVVVVEETGAVWMEDLGSTNGTKRAGAPLPAGQRASVTNGMALQFGGVRLSVVMPEGHEEMLMLPSPAEGESSTAAPASIAAPEGASAARLVGATGETQILKSLRTSFGRRPDNDVVLTGDSFVSGRHAEVLFQDDRFHVLDLDSTNGTRLNGQKLPPNKPEALNDGDEIIMGKTVFVFHGPT
jgi:pSer/pThr/pTyr-binding forkhead associated (FHA) protein